MRQDPEPTLGTFLLGALCGAGLAYLLSPRLSGASAHDFWVKLKSLLTTRSNGIASDGRPPRRHRAGS